MKMKAWIKSLISGLVGSLFMFILMMIAIKGTGVAPFNMPPSAAFLKSLGITPKPLALIIHFGYGAAAAVFLHVVFKNKSKVVYGLGRFGYCYVVDYDVYLKSNHRLGRFWNP